MSIITSASASSCWRGLDYYKDKKVKKIKKISDNEYTSVVSGSNDYNFFLNLKHPKKSTCNCPFTDGKHILCKHIVATYFSVVPNSAKNFEEEQKKLEQEYEENEENEEKQYKKVINYLYKMSKQELIEELVFVFDYAPEWIYDDFIKKNDLED